MCELFCMSSRAPATVNLSLTEFARHGGATAENKDGWGLAYYSECDALVIREPRPAYDSAEMRFVRTHQIGSDMVISHIRHASVGGVALRNTQPYQRELGGYLHVFAHNGTFDDIFTRYPLSGRFQPIGSTDSEYAFCLLLDRLTRLWADRSVPDVQARAQIIRDFASELRELGPANFIYADGDTLFAHGDRRTHEDGIRPPGLHYVSRHCRNERQPVDVPGLTVSTAPGSQDIALVASVPLTDEQWTPFEVGQLLGLKGGETVYRSSS
jgi:predicted glutamine amidotransferase